MRRGAFSYLPLKSFVVATVVATASIPVTFCSVAFCSSSSSSSQAQQQQRQLVEVAPGDCLFTSIAWHVKLTPEQRAAWFDKNNNSATFGSLPEHAEKSAQVKKELVEWMNTQLSSPESTTAKQQLLESWDLITNFGEDLEHFGVSPSAAAAGGGGKQSSNGSDDLLLATYLNVLQHKTVFADMQLMYPAVAAVYKRPVVVFTNSETDFSIRKTKPLVFRERKDMHDTDDSDEARFPNAIELSFPWGSRHYNIVAKRN